MRVRVYGEGEMRVRVNKGKAKFFYDFLYENLADSERFTSG